MGSKVQTVSAYELRITLRDVPLPVWRRVSVPRDITLENLHYVIQVAMGWEDEHLHEFTVKRRRYGSTAEDTLCGGEPVVDASLVRLDGIVKPRAKFRYMYDFGDGWDHEIEVEREVATESEQRQARCLAGENACPPEDVGGAFRYGWILNVLQDPSHEEYDYFREWVGAEFAPEHFDLAETNARMARLPT